MNTNNINSGVWSSALTPAGISVWWRHLHRNERAISWVPRPVVLLGVLALLAQIAWSLQQPNAEAEQANLPDVPSAVVLRAASFGEPVTLSKLVMLWLQTFDRQSGVTIPFRHLDYARVERWLGAALDMDPRGQYPLLAAARVYGEVTDPGRQRRMLDFVYRQYAADPDHRWPWLAHAVLTARHRLNDLPLALKFAQKLADTPNTSAVPSWARQMRIFLLEDMGEIESARILIGGLLASGVITDEHELNFLNERLRSLDKK